MFDKGDEVLQLVSINAHGL